MQRNTLLVAITVFILIGISAGAIGLRSFVRDADTLTRGDLLYGWRRSMEEAQIRRTTEPTARVRLYLTLAERRFREADIAARRTHGPSPTSQSNQTHPAARTALPQLLLGSSIPAGLIIEGGDNVVQAMLTLADVPENSRAVLVPDIERSLRVSETLLDRAAEAALFVDAPATTAVLAASSVLSTYAHMLVGKKPKILGQLPALFIPFDGAEGPNLAVVEHRTALADANKKALPGMPSRELWGGGIPPEILPSWTGSGNTASSKDVRDL